jgi:hypothetical protein
LKQWQESVQDQVVADLRQRLRSCTTHDTARKAAPPPPANAHLADGDSGSSEAPAPASTTPVQNAETAVVELIRRLLWIALCIAELLIARRPVNPPGPC